MSTIHEHKVYICDPEKNTTCDKEMCYLKGGLCCLTYNEDYKSDILADKTVDQLNPLSYGARLPNILRGIYSQKKQGL